MNCVGHFLYDPLKFLDVRSKLDRLLVPRESADRESAVGRPGQVSPVAGEAREI